MAAKIIWKKQEFEVAAPVSVKDALEQLHFDSELYMVIRNGEVISADVELQDGDVAKLIPVMIGG